MQIRQTSPAVGAEVSGVDLRKLSDADFAAIHEAFGAHGVLFFRDQQLAPEDQMAFAQHWGDLVRHPYAGMDPYPDIIELRNNLDSLAAELDPHLPITRVAGMESLLRTRSGRKMSPSKRCGPTFR